MALFCHSENLFAYSKAKLIPLGEMSREKCLGPVVAISGENKRA